MYVKCQIILITQGLRVCEMPDNSKVITQGLRVCEMPDNTYNARSSCM